MSEKVNMHWFGISYRGQMVTGEDASSCLFVGFKEREPKLPIPLINKYGMDSGLQAGAVLVSISYLGYMSKDEFSGESTEKKGKGNQR